MTLAVTLTDQVLLRVPEVARALGLGRSTIHRLIREGRLKAIKIDRATRISREEVQAFVQRHSEV